MYKELRHLQRAGASSALQGRIGAFRLVMGIHVGSSFDEISHNLQMAIPRRVSKMGLSKFIELIQVESFLDKLTNLREIAISGSEMEPFPVEPRFMILVNRLHHFRHIR